MNDSPSGASSEAGPGQQSEPAPGSQQGDRQPSRRFLHANAVWSRLLDGDRVWGSIDILPSRYRISRYGVSRYRLVVSPQASVAPSAAGFVCGGLGRHGELCCGWRRHCA